MTLLDDRHDTMPKADHFDLKENMLELFMVELSINSKWNSENDTGLFHSVNI